MMIATKRGRSRHPPQDLFFLTLEQLFDLGDAAVGELLQLGLGPALLVLADLALLAQLAQVVHAVAADVAHRDPALLREPVHDLDQLLAPLLGQLGDREPDQVAVVEGVSPRSDSRIAFSICLIADLS